MAHVTVRIYREFKKNPKTIHPHVLKKKIELRRWKKAFPCDKMPGTKEAMNGGVRES